MAAGTKQPRGAKKPEPKKVSADQLAKYEKQVTGELSEDELAKVSGGAKITVAF